MNREEAQKYLANRETEDLKSVMRTVEGRRLIWNIIAMSGAFRIGCTCDSRAFYNEGLREIGLRLYASVKTHCLHEWRTAEDERHNDHFLDILTNGGNE